MNVLSLFDGMSCGRIALERAGIKVNQYYASEIDKSAIKVTQANYPNTIQIGDVTKVKYENGMLYTENGEFKVGNIDLVMGGSPCQGFSFAGKQLNFDDPRSALFFEWLRICHEVCPDYFLLENVKMKKESEYVITERLGVEPILINSALVSAQNRKRLYWTNIPGVTAPCDKNIYLKDILIEGVYKEIDISNFNPIKKNSYVQFDVSGKGYNSQQDRAFYPYGKFGCFPNARATTKRKLYLGNGVYRNLTQIECERLQTVPDGYTFVDKVSEGAALCMLGNGWTVDVIAHIFSFLKK